MAELTDDQVKLAIAAIAKQFGGAVDGVLAEDMLRRVAIQTAIDQSGSIVGASTVDIILAALDGVK